MTPASDQRKFLFSAAPESRIVLLEGATDDLDALVEFLADFRGGVSLEDLDARFPFVWIGSGARAYEQGESTAAQWRELLTADWCREERPLVEAAYADTRLREIFPGLSHGALRFDAPLGTPRGRVAIVVPLADGTVRVERIDPDRGQRRVDVVTLPEASTGWPNCSPDARDFRARTPGDGRRPHTARRAVPISLQQNPRELDPPPGRARSAR